MSGLDFVVGAHFSLDAANIIPLFDKILDKLVLVLLVGDLSLALLERLVQDRNEHAHETNDDDEHEQNEIERTEEATGVLHLLELELTERKAEHAGESRVEVAVVSEMRAKDEERELGECEEDDGDCGREAEKIAAGHAQRQREHWDLVVEAQQFEEFESGTEHDRRAHVRVDHVPLWDCVEVDELS